MVSDISQWLPLLDKFRTVEWVMIQRELTKLPFTLTIVYEY